MKVVLEYIWQDHNGGFRSKTKVTDMDEVTLDKLSMWNYDGSCQNSRWFRFRSIY